MRQKRLEAIHSLSERVGLQPPAPPRRVSRFWLGIWGVVTMSRRDASAVVTVAGTFAALGGAAVGTGVYQSSRTNQSAFENTLVWLGFALMIAAATYSVVVLIVLAFGQVGRHSKHGDLAKRFQLAQIMVGMLDEKTPVQVAVIRDWDESTYQLLREIDGTDALAVRYKNEVGLTVNPRFTSEKHREYDHLLQARIMRLNEIMTELGQRP